MYADDPMDPRRDRQMQPAAPAAAVPAGVGGAPAAPAGGAAPAPAPAHAGTGYINLAQYVGANQQGAQGMAGQIAGNIAGEGQRAEGELAQLHGEAHRSTADKLSDVNPGLFMRAGADASKAAADAKGATTSGGLGALLTDQYGKQGGYSSGMRGFDSFLTGNAGGDQFQSLASRYGPLAGQLGLAEGEYRPSASNAPGMGGGPAGGHGPITMEPAPTGGPRGPRDSDPYLDPRKRRRAF